MNIDKNELLARLIGIREACKIATSPKDNNLNLIIEEIDRLASVSISQISPGTRQLFLGIPLPRRC